MDYAQGCDISRYQTILDGQRVIKPVDFQKMKAQGVKFCYVRAMTIWGEKDWAFDNNWAGSKAAGIPRGVYGFNNQEKPIWYAANFFNIVSETGDLGELPPWLDYEQVKIKNPPPLPSEGACYQWCDEVERLFGKRPMWYTNKNYSIKKPSARLAQYELAAARYKEGLTSPWSDNPAKYRITGFRDWTFWQWGTPAWGKAYGCQSEEIDMDRFNGDESVFRAWAGLAHLPTLEERVTELEKRVAILEGK